jgi:hypothetical protein
VQISKGNQANCTLEVRPLSPSEIPGHWYL